MRGSLETTQTPWHRRPPSPRTRLLLIAGMIGLAAAIAIATWGALPWRWDFAALNLAGGVALGALAHAQRRARLPVAALVGVVVLLVGIHAHVVPRMFGARAMSGAPASHATAVTTLSTVAGLLLFRLGVWARARRSATHG